jgi:uncharacterized cupredoxin-like copper-binding protein
LPGIADGSTNAAELAPTATAEFTVQFTPTNFGIVTFSVAVAGTNPGGIETSSLTSTSAAVDIAPRGDLWIKTGDQSDSDYAGVGIYQSVPAPPQIVTSVVQTGTVATFDIQIVNNEDEPMDFTLSATDEGTNWTTHYLLTNMDLATLAPGASLTLVIETTSTNTDADSNPIQITLGLQSVPDLVADSVEAVAVTAAGPGLPELSITANGKNITLSWPVWAGTYSLQGCTNISANNWETIVASPTTNAQILSLILPSTQTSSFFRLQMQ